MRLLSLLACIPPLLLLSMSATAADSNYQVTVRVIGVSKISAILLLDDPRFVSDPTAMLQHLDSLVTRHEAEDVITQSTRTALPGRGRIEKAKVWETEFDAGAPKDGKIFMNVSVSHADGGRLTMLNVNPTAKLGVPRFIGTLQLPDSDSTFLVFLTVR